MKYIRTKDGRILGYDYVKSVPIKFKVKQGFTKEQVLQELEEKSDVVRVADTIEELCGVIVCNEKLFYPLTSNREGNKFNWEEIISCSHNVSCNADYKGKAEDLYFNIYGAIWTDKGLIYVAKMNGRGELELL